MPKNLVKRALEDARTATPASKLVKYRVGRDNLGRSHVNPGYCHYFSPPSLSHPTKKIKY